jgi:TatD DNase family protein
VIHCFSGNAAEATTFVEEFGMLLGIGGVLTFKTAEGLRDAVRTVGLAPVIMETDCPYLAPVPYRGKRNEPAFMTESAAMVAKILNVDLATVSATTTATAKSFFGLS